MNLSQLLPEHEAIHTLKKAFFLEVLSPEETARFKSSLHLRKYPKGHTIFFEHDPGDAVYFIHEGMIKITKQAEDGRVKILSILKKGDYFGEMSVLDEEERSATAEVLVDAKVFVIYRKELLEILKDHPEVPLQIIKTLSRRLRSSNSQIEQLTFFTTQQRLAHTIIQLANNFSAGDKDGSEVIHFNLTHQDLADLCGMSRETCTRYLNKFEQEELIRIKKPYMYLMGRDKLQEIATPGKMEELE